MPEFRIDGLSRLFGGGHYHRKDLIRRACDLGMEVRKENDDQLVVRPKEELSRFELDLREKELGGVVRAYGARMQKVVKTHDAPQAPESE